MPKINLLSKHISELIAAGEVVERPSSVIKELVENSIDAGATRITVEIQRGGILYMRITDNGCGISFEDVPLAFMRHATSKISSDADLDCISTLGFRGEALAATASVSKIELFTRTPDSEVGTHYRIDGGTQMIYEESGGPEGTTIIVRDLFYNTPARMKFLKKDVSEGNAVSAVIERLAISHPEISFKLIREGKQVISTTGDGKQESAIYSLLGREFSKALIPVNFKENNFEVSGFVCKPVNCRQSRAGQFIYLNSRLVHSGTVTAAVEQAYKNSAMIGKFPAFVINLKVPFNSVDVNIHPAKTEIRFSDEKKIFDTVFYAVKNAILSGDVRPTIEIKTKSSAAMPVYGTQNSDYRQGRLNVYQNPGSDTFKDLPDKKAYYTKAVDLNAAEPDVGLADFLIETAQNVKPPLNFNRLSDITVDEDAIVNQTSRRTSIDKKDFSQTVSGAESREASQTETFEDESFESGIRLVGEAFHTYIIVECKNSIFLIDKHAAHERILFNRLKKEQTVETQQLLMPVTVRLSALEYEALISNEDLLLKAGFEVEDFGNNSIVVRAVPSTLLNEDVPSVITEAANALLIKNSVEVEALDRLYHTVSCKAAIKAGYLTTDTELLQLAKRVLRDRDVMYCPHGRPVAYEIKKSDLEKQFGRIQ